LQAIEALGALNPGWDGDGSPAPTPASLAVARRFALAIDRRAPAPSAGPAGDGGVAFEWDLPEKFSIYCYAREDDVEVAAFDDERDYIDIALPPDSATGLVSAVLDAQTAPV
jgi:hypothetical protein